MLGRLSLLLSWCYSAGGKPFDIYLGWFSLSLFDPFNQPGVEAYKENFFPALDKTL